MIVPALEQLVTFFGNVHILLDEGSRLRAIVNVEVFGAQYLPLKIGVPDFVPSEVMELSVEGEEKDYSESAV